MKINRIIIASCFALVLLTGCSKMLDIPQNGVVSQDDYYKTDEEAESAIATVYHAWRARAENIFSVLETLSDDVSKGGTNVNFFPNWRERNSYTYNSGNEGVATFYTDSYELIYFCNLVIEKVSGDTDVQKRCIAEAKFFRALTYSYIAALWGENAPVVDHLLEPEEYHVTNSEDGALWALVNEDLTDAIAVLPSKKSKDDQSLTRVTKEAAECVLGKAYMWQKEYGKAAAEFEKVIGSGLYDLWDGDFDLLLHVEANQCCEKILEAIVPDDAANYEANHINNMNSRWTYFGWAIKQKYNVSKEANEIFVNGDEYMPPRESLYKAFKAEEDAYAVDPSNMKDRFHGTLRTVWELADEGVTLKSDMPDHDYYMNWKTRLLINDLMGKKPMGQRGVKNQCINIGYIRYADILLLAAEAYVKLGTNQAKADEYLNKVRTRAGLKNKPATLEAIKLERRLELCFEANRYLDLIRWQRIDGTHDAFNALKDQGKETYNLVVTKEGDGFKYERVADSKTNPDAGFKEGKHELLPIPQGEIDVNGNNVKQNPGW